MEKLDFKDKLFIAIAIITYYLVFIGFYYL